MFDDIKQLLNDKKMYTIFMATFIVAVFIVIFVIWWPEGDDEPYAKYEDINLEDKYAEISKEYFNTLIFYVRYGQTGEIASKISDVYLGYVGKTKSEIEEEFFSKKIIGFNKVEINSHQNIVVYSTTLAYEDGTTRKMNLVETYPYNYTITFDDFLTCESVNISNVTSNTKVYVQNVYSGYNSKTYEISITNLNNNRVTFDISNAKTVYLELENGEKYYLGSTVVTDDLQNISKGTTVNKKLEFSIPFSVQSKINKIVFKDVKIDGTTVNISMNL